MSKGLIRFFRDSDDSLLDAALIRSGDELTAAIVGGVDLGLSSALVDYALYQAGEHERLAVRAFHAGHTALGEHHVKRGQAWLELHGEALAALTDIYRIRSN